MPDAVALAALLLDFGGTLASEGPSRGGLYARSARARGGEVGGDAMGELMARVHDAMSAGGAMPRRYSDEWFHLFIARVFHGELGLPREQIPGIAAELFARFEDAASFRVFRGAAELLASARAAGLRTAVVSDWSAHLEALLANLGLARHLDAIVSSAVVGAEKPDRAIFRAALERLGVAPERALHAGDDLRRDVFGARDAGLASVLVDHRDRHSAPPPGVARVTSFAALREHLAASGGWPA